MSESVFPATGTGSPMSRPLRAAADEAARCIHCGFCLPVCPTYQVFGQEKHSPRGRIQLVKAWSDGRVAPDPSFLEALDLCLGCRACETACPVHVRYGLILEEARDELARRRSRNLAHRLQRWALRHIASHPRRLRLIAGATAGLLHGIAGRALEKLAARRPGGWLGPAVTFARALPRSPAARRGAIAQSPGRGPRAALFLGCAQEGLFPHVNDATARLLAATGFTVETPPGQVCCGALHRHQGDVEYARELVRMNLAAFGFLGGEPPDVVVLNAGGCLAWIQEAASLFAPGTAEHEGARRLAERARDIASVLVQRGWKPHGAVGGRALRVVYQPSCHLTHVCGVTEAPLALLRALPGFHVELPADGGACCGSAGIYSALHPQASAAVLARKLQHIPVEGSLPDVIVTSNPGCHLQMAAGVRRGDMADRVAVMQLPEFIDWYLTDRRSIEKGAPDAAS